MKHNFLKPQSTNLLCDTCKPFGYCKLDHIRQTIETQLHGMPKQFTFKDFAKYIPLRPFNGSYGTYSNQYLQQACDAFHQEDFETALLHFKAALEGRANITFAYLGIALCYFKMNYFEMALQYIEYKNNFSNGGRKSKIDEYFTTICEIGLKEIELKQQKDLLHDFEQPIQINENKFLVSAFM